jgi:hypothetical protein
MATPNLDPHPLVTALGSQLGAPGSPLQEAGAKFNKLKDGAKRGATEAQDLANALAQDPRVSELVTFAGYLGGNIAQIATSPPGNWRVMYLDSKLLTWVLVDDDDILFRDIVEDESAAFRERDIIWISADAMTLSGRGRQSVQGQFLSGEFTRAGDFRSSLAGGTLAPATGIFCDAETPSCCGRHTR